MTGPTVAVAMSGGVDSSVAALLLKQAGFKVTGVTMHLFGSLQENAAERAKTIAAALDIGHQVIDLSAQFQSEIVGYFCEDYRRGLTPNPCIVCNKLIKFGALQRYADSIGAQFLATGHYARIKISESGFHLYKAFDVSKDQSYFLYRLNQEQLSRVLLPLGAITKDQVRQLAKDADLPAFPSESQDICFLEGEDYRSFLESRVESTPGDIVDEQGKIVGRHLGIAHYTIGQRQGLGVASNIPQYVVAIDGQENQIVIGSEKSLVSKTVRVKDLNWISGVWPADTTNLSARIRYRMPNSPITNFEATNGTSAIIDFENPVRAVTPGQSTVIYRCDEVLGGGIITA